MKGYIIQSLDSINCDTKGCEWSRDLSTITNLSELAKVIEEYRGSTCPICKAELVTDKDVDIMLSLIKIERWLQKHPCWGWLFRLLIPKGAQESAMHQSDGEGKFKKI